MPKDTKLVMVSIRNEENRCINANVTKNYEFDPHHLRLFSSGIFSSVRREHIVIIIIPSTKGACVIFIFFVKGRALVYIEVF